MPKAIEILDNIVQREEEEQLRRSVCELEINTEHREGEHTSVETHVQEDDMLTALVIKVNGAAGEERGAGEEGSPGGMT